MKSLILMLQFFTRIPININLDLKKEDFQKGIPWFPIVGLVIGGFSALVYYGVSKILPGGFPILAALLISALLTGGLHIDGLADTCDGLFSARSKEKMLDIMRDSRIGTNGALAILFNMLFYYVLLTYLDEANAVRVIVLSPVAGRSMIAYLCWNSCYAREGEGLGTLFIGSTPLSKAVTALLIGIVITALLGGVKGVVSFVVCIVVIEIYKRYVHSKIGGMTGDTLGAGNQLGELFFLLFYTVFIGKGIL